jgi:hypothetical protein
MEAPLKLLLELPPLCPLLCPLSSPPQARFPIPEHGTPEQEYHRRRSTKPRGIYTPASDSSPLRFSHQIPLDIFLLRISICSNF